MYIENDQKHSLLCTWLEARVEGSTTQSSDTTLNRNRYKSFRRDDRLSSHSRPPLPGNCGVQMAEPQKGVGREAFHWLENLKLHTPAGLEKAEVGFYDALVGRRIKIERTEKGRVVCSFKVTPGMCNLLKMLHGGILSSLVDVIGTAAIVASGSKITGVSVDINVSHVNGAKLGDEVEIDAKCLGVGENLAQVSVDFTDKETGQVIAQGRHTKYLSIPRPKL
eukprot:TRINITY_DN2090_c0_g1_i1.p1 TRINITY_DN2090_c0_g1~~TRINITY_DN2090_c0_g1_i1.p1  ORF type:complete len:222 (-),score=17.45 TRINITY_DN2090_c0_g1_i1:235-900(-)